jgi:hypothetical protein
MRRTPGPVSGGDTDGRRCGNRAARGERNLRQRDSRSASVCSLAARRPCDSSHSTRGPRGGEGAASEATPTPSAAPSRAEGYGVRLPGLCSPGGGSSRRVGWERRPRLRRSGLSSPGGGSSLGVRSSDPGGEEASGGTASREDEGEVGGSVEPTTPVSGATLRSRSSSGRRPSKPQSAKGHYRLLPLGIAKPVNKPKTGLLRTKCLSPSTAIYHIYCCHTAATS